MSAENLITLYKLYVGTTYFSFNKKLYQQIDGLAIGASSSGPAADLFMERLEKRALTTFVEPPSLWKRYVDDTFCKLKKIYVESFLRHLNSQHHRMKFTSEIEKDRMIVFLDALVHILQDRTTKTTIYRKATHTDQYLDFTSNHHIKQKIGIVKTFEHRAEALITKEEDKIEEVKHVKKALRRCGHPVWSLNRKKDTKRKETQVEKPERRGKVVLPYIKGTSEKLARTLRKYDIESIHKPTTKLKQTLCNKMKDKVEPLDKTGAVYYNYCKKHRTPKRDYVGETDRVVRKRLYEHRILDHKTSERSASIDLEAEDKKDQEKGPQGEHRSKRQKEKKRIDYKAMQEGSNQLLSEGST